MSKDDLIKLSAGEELILGLLVAGGEMYGLQMVERSNGCLARGSVYVTLERMTEKGLVESRQESKVAGVSGIPRRLYKPTGAGARAYRQWVRRRETALIKLATA